MQWLILGTGLLVAVVLIARWYSTAEPKEILRVARWAGLALAAFLVVLLLVMGRVGLLWVAAMALLPWLSRLRTIARIFKSARGPSRGKSSGVRTKYLAMSLDHDSGAMDGEVLTGHFAGRMLSSMDEVSLFALLNSAADDPQSVSVLEAYLDRAHGADWRERMAGRGGDGAGAGTRAAAGGQMTREEALAILGLGADATEAEIKRSHRELMMKVHPDHGGSDYLASKLNAAKEVLLGN